MTSYVPVVKNAGAILYLGLPSMATLGGYQANPTLAAGDVKVSVDGGAFGNVASLPSVTPAAGAAVKLTLSAGETNGDNIIVAFIDQTSPKEWSDTIVHIQTAARLIDDLAFPLTTGRGLAVDATGQVNVAAIAANAIT